MALVERRSLSPATPMRNKGLKGNSLIQAISKRLTRKSCVDLEEDDAGSSSGDSYTSNSIDRLSRSRDVKMSLQKEAQVNNVRSVSSQHLSTSSADVPSDSVHIKSKRYYSTSAESIMRAFEILTIGNAKNKPNDGKEKKKSKKNKKPPPKRILRSPVKYVYVKGWSGLPTQRIPVSRTYAGYPAGCRMQYIAGLNR